MADPRVHKRFLDYREMHAYFGRNIPILDYASFEAYEDEHAALARKGEGARDDEEEARFVALEKLLLKD